MSQIPNETPISLIRYHPKKTTNYQKRQNQIKQSKDVFIMQMVTPSKHRKIPEYQAVRKEIGKEHKSTVEAYDSDMINNQTNGVTELIYYSNSTKMLNSKPISSTREKLGIDLFKSYQSQSHSSNLDLYHSVTLSSRNLHQTSLFKSPLQDKEMEFERNALTQSQRQFKSNTPMEMRMGLLSQSQRTLRNQMDNSFDMRLSMREESRGALASESPLYSSSIDINRHLNSHSGLNERYGIHNERMNDKEYNISHFNKDNQSKEDSQLSFEQKILRIQAYLRGYWQRVNMSSYQNEIDSNLSTNNMLRKTMLLNKRYEQFNEDSRVISSFDRNKAKLSQTIKSIPPLVISQTEVVSITQCNDENRKKEEHHFELLYNQLLKQIKESNKQRKLMINTNYQFELINYFKGKEYTASYQNTELPYYEASSLIQKSEEKDNEAYSHKIQNSIPDYKTDCFYFDIININDTDKEITSSHKPILKSKKKIILNQNSEENIREDLNPYFIEFNLKSSQKPMCSSKNHQENCIDYIISSQHVFHIFTKKLKPVYAKTKVSCFDISSTYAQLNITDQSNINESNTLSINTNSNTKTKGFNLTCLSIEKVIQNSNAKPKGKHAYRWRNKRNKIIKPMSAFISNRINDDLMFNEDDLLIGNQSSITIEGDIPQTQSHSHTIYDIIQSEEAFELIKEQKEKNFDIETIDLEYTTDNKTNRNQNKSIQYDSNAQFVLALLEQDSCASITILHQSSIQPKQKAIVSIEQANSFTLFDIEAISQSQIKSNEHNHINHSRVISSSLTNLTIESNYIEITSSLDVSLSKISKDTKAFHTHMKLNTVESFCLPTQSNTINSQEHLIHKSYQSSPNIESPIQLPINTNKSLKSSFNDEDKNRMSFQNAFNKPLASNNELDYIGLNERSESNIIIHRLTSWDDTNAVTHFNFEINLTEDKSSLHQGNEQIDIRTKSLQLESSSFGIEINSKYSYNDVLHKAETEIQLKKKAAIEYHKEEQFEIIKDDKVKVLVTSSIRKTVLPLKLKNNMIKVMREYGYNALLHKLKESICRSKKQSIVSIRKVNELKKQSAALRKWKLNSYTVDIIRRLHQMKEELNRSLIRPEAAYSMEINIDKKQDISIPIKPIELHQILENSIEIVINKQPVNELLFPVKESDFEIISINKDNATTTRVNESSIQSRFEIINKDDKNKALNCIMNNMQLEIIPIQGLNQSKNEILCIQIENSFPIIQYKVLNQSLLITNSDEFSYQGLSLPSTESQLIQTNDDIAKPIIILQVDSSNHLFFDNNKGRIKKDKLKMISNIFKSKCQLNTSNVFHQWHYNSKKTEHINVKMAQYFKSMPNEESETLVLASKETNQLKKGSSLSKLQAILYKSLISKPFNKLKNGNFNSHRRQNKRSHSDVSFFYNYASKYKDDISERVSLMFKSTNNDNDNDEIVLLQKTVLYKVNDIIKQRKYLFRPLFNKWKNQHINSSLLKIITIYEQKQIKVKERECQLNNNNYLYQYYYSKWKSNLINNNQSQGLLYSFTSGANSQTIKSVIKDQINNSNKEPISLPNQFTKRVLFKIQTKYTIIKKLTLKLMRKTIKYILRKHFNKWKSKGNIFYNIQKRIMKEEDTLELPPVLMRVRKKIDKRLNFEADILKYCFVRWKTMPMIKENEEQIEIEEEDKGKTFIVNVKKVKMKVSKKKIKEIEYDTKTIISLYIQSKLLKKRWFKKWKAYIINSIT